MPRGLCSCVKIAVDLVSEGVCSKNEALQMVEPAQHPALHQGIDPSINIVPVARAFLFSGAAAGRVVLMRILLKRKVEGEVLSGPLGNNAG